MSKIFLVLLYFLCIIIFLSSELGISLLVLSYLSSLVSGVSANRARLIYSLHHFTLFILLLFFLSSFSSCFLIGHESLLSPVCGAPLSAYVRASLWSLLPSRCKIDVDKKLEIAGNLLKRLFYEWRCEEFKPRPPSSLLSLPPPHPPSEWICNTFPLFSSFLLSPPETQYLSFSTQAKNKGNGLTNMCWCLNPFVFMMQRDQDKERRLYGR